MKHRVSELEGALLDAAVAKAEGMIAREHPAGLGLFYGDFREIAIPVDRWCPSSDWAIGGPIIERERITLLSERAADGEDGWSASVDASMNFSKEVTADSWVEGPTPLIAAMRAYVASRLGEEIEL